MMSSIRSRRATATTLPSQSDTLFPTLRAGLLIGLVLFFAIGGAQTASAQEMLRAAKAAQQVGEGFDGFIALIDQDAPANVKKLVADTNDRRKERYEKVARLRDSDLESVGKQAAVIIYKRAATGDLLQTADGKWKKHE